MAFRSPLRAVGVVGTVTTTSAGSSASGPAFRGARTPVSSASGGNLSITTPAATVAGDLLVLVVSTANGSVPAVSGFTQLAAYTQRAEYMVVYTRTATAADAAAGASYTVPLGSTYAGIASMVAVSGAVRANVAAAAPSLDSGGSATVSTGNVSSGSLILVLAGANANDAAPTFAWVAAGSGGPPATQPAFTSDGTSVISYATLAVSHVVSNWPTASYQLTISNPGSGSGAGAALVFAS